MKKTEITKKMRDMAAEIENKLFKWDDLKEEIKFLKEKTELITREANELRANILDDGFPFMKEVFGKETFFDDDELEYEVARILKDYEGE